MKATSEDREAGAIHPPSEYMLAEPAALGSSQT
jgi:hypothetical protein